MIECKVEANALHVFVSCKDVKSDLCTLPTHGHSRQSKSPCNLSASVHGCWWPVSAGCPGVDPRTVCPLARPYEYGNDDAGW